MWHHVELPLAGEAPEQREKRIQQFAEEKMRAYDGTVFLCISRSDKERRITFRQAAQAVGYTAKDEIAVSAAGLGEDFIKRYGRNVLFVYTCLQEYMGDYLDACPAGAKHVLLYCRRKGNGPSPRMSAFMDFWQERGMEIWDLGDQ